MRLIQFIKWWWDKHDLFDRVIALFLIFGVVPAAIASIFVGSKAVLILLISTISIAVIGAIYGLFYIIGSSWKDFNEEVPTDDVRIIRKLKGLE